MKKSEFQGTIKEMEFSEIEKALKNIEEFSDFKSWSLKRLKIGEMYHTYVLSKGNKKYFIKEIKPHEAQILYFLNKINLKHIPGAVNLRLLDKKILLSEFIEGHMLKFRKIDLGLLNDFIIFQNKMKDKKFFDRYNHFKLKNYSNSDNGFFKSRFKSELKTGRMNLINAKRKYTIPIIDKYLQICDYLKLNQDKISEDFSKMPFTRQHHDFKENNIIKSKNGDILIDWGSSYGYGPFMYDLAIFLIHDKKALKILMNKSNLANKYSKAQIERWLYVSLAYRYTDFTNWYIRKKAPNLESEIKLKKILNYNYKTYSYLLK